MSGCRIGHTDTPTTEQRNTKFRPYLCPPKTETPMATETTSTGKYWLYFLISLVLTIIALMFFNQWFWVFLPFTLTFLVMALDYM